MIKLKTHATHFSQRFTDADKLADGAQRVRKAAKIQAVLAAEQVPLVAGTRLLDIGCSHGLMLQQLTTTGSLGVGIDLDRTAAYVAADNIFFSLADGELLPFPAHCFDVVICNHIYEHTDDPARLMAEIARVLKPTGICYFAGPNKYSLIEPHYQVPLLSWLPQPLADFYVQQLGVAAHYAIRPYSPWALRRLLTDFVAVDYRAAIVADPCQYAVEDILPPASIKQWIARFVLQWLPWLFPDFVFVLRHKSAYE